MSKHVRIVVKLRKENEAPRIAHFTECILQQFGLSGGKGHVQVCLKDNCLEISDKKFAESTEVFVKHPSFCPVLHISQELIAKLPEDIFMRGVDVGAAVVLESCDGSILLIRRARHLRIFPGLWVPPGGHVEENETLLEAGLRELREETGLQLSPKDCVEGKVELLALWESVFPPKLSVGLPKRHHIVVYFHARLVKGLTASVLEDRLKFDPGEVDACAWLDRNLVTFIANCDDEDDLSPSSFEHLPKAFRALVLDEGGKQCPAELPTAPLFRIHSDNEDEDERVSTGTKFALQQFLMLPNHS
ncbi:hypothetical protein EGW08_010625 [Elysia chlorotica]|uniref:m7GpppN-mRNA hydrolase NUDT17 n=1 Tax=Elysia chlorotica TaxID=188477 RepID=A0A433TJ49_ELYCH|nr:hypothetical protein EGW08_010625 [Elysia chlorotica]